ncbi:hypothetical protein [Polyangium spumosum]|uniref:Uncharacterized protein n=1 Tax=Polyangium spumosum TaxID=889282 RepID=A0A6N7PMH8_9BACT|nr:hypothetical protein [Polyangium spumosum]MRG91480.1 hypothetical protein [Polyangium spumosum]
MIERVIPRFGRLVFDQDAIVRAALRAYVETSLYRIARFEFPAYDWAGWMGDIERGTLFYIRDWRDWVVVAWTEAGIVGLAYDGWGSIQHRTLSADAVTGGPDDVRWALPGLPEELEPALVLATSTLGVGCDHGERSVGSGFWLSGGRIAGRFFEDPDDGGASWLAAWGLLHKGRLLPRYCHPRPGKIVVNHARPQDAPAHAIMDAVVDRRLKGPTEFTPAEIEMLLLPAPDPKRVLDAQRSLQEVGITWPGSPALPPEKRQPWFNGFTAHEYVGPPHFTQYFGPVAFNRDAIVRAALRAYVETILAPLDPLARHVLTACVVPKWTGDLQRGAFFNGDGCGDYDVVAWTEAGVVGLAYKRGAVPGEQLGALLPGLPDELLPALEMAAGLLERGAQGEKLATIGFWLSGDHTGGTLFDDPTLPGARRLVAWGALDRLVPWGTQDETGKGRLPLLGDRDIAALAVMLARTMASPIHALIDAVTDRALKGPTELLPDELATLFPTPPEPEERLSAQRMLQKVGITWPGMPEMPEVPQGAGRSPFLASPRAIGRCHPLGYLVFDRDAIVRAAFRAYVEVTLAYLDPRQCHPIPPDCGRTWTGDLQRGALAGRTTVAWSEAGVVAIVFESRWRPSESVPEGPVATNPDDVRRVVPDLPDALLPTLEMACGLIDQRHHIQTARVGFWLCGDSIGGTLFDTPTADGAWTLATWGRVGRGRLLPRYPHNGATITADTFKAYAPFLAVVDAVVERALKGPTELTQDEFTTLFPLPPLPGPALPAQRKLQQVGITWS